MKECALYRLDPVSENNELLTNIDNSIIIGTSKNADVTIEDWQCDGIHAYLELDDDNDKFILTDLGSKYGTFYNGSRINETGITPGDTFNIGGQQLSIQPLGKNQESSISAKDSLDLDALIALGDDITAADLGKLMAPGPSDTQINPIFKDTATVKAALGERDLLEVTLSWSEMQLETRTFLPGSAITIGMDKKCTFQIPLSDDKYLNTKYNLAKYIGDSLEVWVPNDGIGLFWQGNKAYSIDTLRKNEDFKLTQGKGNNNTIVESDDRFLLTLKAGDKLYLEFGELALAFEFKTRPEKLPFKLLPQIDPKLLKALGILAGFYLLLILILLIGDMEDEVKTLKDVPKHLKKVLYNAGVAEAQKKRQAAIGQIAATLQGGRARAEEGKSSSKRQPKKVQKTVKKVEVKTKKPPTPIKQPPPKRLDMDSAFKVSPSADVVKTTSIVGAKRAGTSASSLNTTGFARGAIGLGAGGGGQSVGVGALKGHSVGGGMGAGDSGLLPSKGREISIPETEVIEIQGGLDRDVISAIIKRYLPQIQHCYEKGLVIRPNLKGKVSVAFVIGKNGNIDSAKIGETSLNDKVTENCIISRVMKWKFPKPKGGGTVGVKYPFLLMSSNTGS